MAKDPQKVGERKAFGDRRRDDYTTKANQRKLTRRIKKLNKATEKLDPGGSREVRRRSGSYVDASKMSADAMSAERKATSRGADREDISGRKKARLIKKVQKKSKKVTDLTGKAGPDTRKRKGEGRKVNINISLPKRKKKQDKPPKGRAGIAGDKSKFTGFRSIYRNIFGGRKRS